MKTIRELLKNTEPLEHEASWSTENRSAVRRKITAAASTSDSEVVARPVGWSLRSPAPVAILGVIAIAVAFVALGFGPAIWPHNVQAAVHFEMRLAEDTPGAGLQAAIVRSTGRTIYLHEGALITNSDIMRATVAPGRTSGTFNVEVLFTVDGAEKVGRATADHIGRPIALVVDGSVINAPTVRSAIGDSAIINGDFTESEAEIMAAGIDKR